MINLISQKKIRCFVLIFILIAQSNLWSQEQKNLVTGKVTDAETGEPLFGANVLIAGKQKGTITDIDGGFKLAASSDDVLTFSMLGYVSSSIKVLGQTVINVSLKEDMSTLNEVVVVGYGTQKKQSVTGSVSQIKGDELLKAPTGNITNALGGRVAGVVALQQSGQPGADGSNILIRGSSAKYIVDGIQRKISEIDPNEIETMSVLKDASSAAIYGLDANAVVIITTKRGKLGVTRINANHSYGISTNAVMMDMLDGPGYAYWHNKARELDGDLPIFTRNHLELMLNGDDSDGWGNTNWYKETFKIGENKNYNINATGGTEKLKYFASLGSFNQKGNVKGFNYNRINLRSNIDAEVANNLHLTFDISGRIEDRKRPGFSASPNAWNNIGQQAIRAHPYVPMQIDGKPVSTRTASSYVNPLASSALSGYSNVKRNVIQTNLALKYDVPFIEGLNVKFLTAYDISLQTSKSFSKPYFTYLASLPALNSNTINYTLTNDARGTNASLVEGQSNSTRLTTNFSLNYKKTFKNHTIAALALVESINVKGNSFGAYGYGFDIYELDELIFANLEEKNAVSGASYEEKKRGYVGRLNYDYAKKYLLELSARYDGSHVFGGMTKGKRWGLFPAASVGWRVSEESWFKNKNNAFNDLKLRGSVGLTGTTQIPPYYYLNTLSFLNNPAVVLNGQPQSGLITSRPANTNLTWGKSLQYNGGVDLKMWDGLFNVEFDVFYKYVYDMLSSVDATYPPSFGGYVFGFENKNKQDHKGFEVVISHRNKIGDFSYGFAINGTYTKRRWLRFSDSENTPDWLKLTSKEVGAQIGFIAEGLFQSQEDIDNSPLIVGKDVRVGDIKYRDRNGDGIISFEQDRGYIGKSAYPKFIGGFSFDAEWRGIDISFLFQGALGRDVALTGVYPNGIMDHTSMTRPFYHGGNSPRFLVENSWTENNVNAEFPRLSLVPASSNNAFSSTFWYRNGDYLRLKTVQLGYNFPGINDYSKVFKNLRIYLEGQNLLTFSGLNKYNIDPEQPGVSNGYYPQQRLISAGLKLSF